jgi:hypothetical protein
MKTKPILTTDLADFGFREIQLASDLLSAWVENGLPDDFDKDAVTVMFNTESSWVFITNSESDVAIIGRSGQLERLYLTPTGEHEGTLDELRDQCDQDTWDDEDIEWIASQS